MSENFEVSTPILNGPFDPPREHWKIEPDRPAARMPSRRKAGYFYRPPRAPGGEEGESGAGEWRELELVNLIRERMAKWQAEGRSGLTRTSTELITYWRRQGREQRLFFAQLEATETIIFLSEARADYLQGIFIPLDEPSDERKVEGFAAFKRLCCKMATGSGKSTVMAMLAAWSILNKVANRSDARFSDTVLVVCPNVTIRNRLQEIDPRNGEASLYRTRDLIPERLMPELQQGRVIIWNWHVFEPQGSAVGGTGARVIKAGKAIEATETFTVAGKTTSLHGKKYITPEVLDARVAKGELRVLEDKTDKNGRRTVKVLGTAYVESDTASVNRVLSDAVSKSNILVLNDEAHHAYRIKSARAEEEEDESDQEGEEEDLEYQQREATVWIDGLDKVSKLRGVNVCVDLSATPYFIGGHGQATNTIFPWTVSDFGLTDAIESGLVKIPQLAVRDNTGAEIPGYFNIWRWILPKLTAAERGGRKSNPKPEAILKYAYQFVAQRWQPRRGYEVKEDGKLTEEVAKVFGVPSGALENVTMNPYRKSHRLQQVVFEMARDLAKRYLAQPECNVPAHVLFPQLVTIVERYVRELVIPVNPAERIDIAVSPYYGWVIERLVEAIKPDASAGEPPELPTIEANRPSGTTGEVDFWTSRDVRPVIKSHVNYVVADTKQWEQSAAYFIDTNDAVDAFVKNAGLGFAIPYLHNGQMHDYEPDFIVRIKGKTPINVILETKGYDQLKQVKRQAAERWVAAVNADGRFGHWRYQLIEEISDVPAKLTAMSN
jgi:Type III restriction enzyme, res subunit